MNKKPIILRSLFALLVMGVFLFSMFPLGHSDFFETFTSVLKKPLDPVVQKVIDTAKKDYEASKKAGNPIYESTALDIASGKMGVMLPDYVDQRIRKAQKLNNNGDVIGYARKLSAGSIRLGIDLNGGAEFLLKLEQNEKQSKDVKKEDIANDFERRRDIAIETLRNRLESKNIYESEISPAGQNLISLRVPVVSTEEKSIIENLIKMSANLSFALVAPNNAELVTAYEANPKAFKTPEGYKMWTSDEIENGKLRKRIYFVEIEPQMDGRNIVDARVQMTQYGQREILLTFNPEGAVQFGNVTSKNVGRALAIILDGKLYSAPTIQTAITGGNAQITGNFSREEAENIANALVSGSVPFTVSVEAKYDIDPTIGQETVRDGLWSGILGTVLVMIFMVIYYLRAGLVANISLLVNALLMLGAIAAFNVTLTLPGIAGIILTIGMAVDANVLIYERIREEITNGKAINNAIDIGFGKAFAAIFDSNITTLFVALILLWQGTGAIKGFAMTLAIGIFTTLFTAVFLTRLLFDLMTRYTHVKTLKMHQIFKNTHFDFLAFRFYALTLSGILILATFVTVGIRGRDLLGIDFTGGTQIELNYDYNHAVPADQIAKALSELGYDVKATYKTPGSMTVDQKKLEVLLRGTAGKGDLPKEMMKKYKAQDEKALVTSYLNSKFPQAKFEGATQSTLGSLIGWTFTKSAIISLSLALLGMLLYMTIRFEFSYSVAANLAVVHDVIIAIGIYIMCGGEITMNVIAASLTLIGYSVNDTIVNFDRIRENLELVKGKTYAEIINLSVNQTLGRTFLTSFTVLLVLIMQLCFGGASIRDFVIIMLLGVIIGTYSTIYIASIVVDYWHRNKPLPTAAGSEKSTEPDPGV